LVAQGEDLMEIAAGAALLLVALYFLPLGRSARPKAGAEGAARPRFPAWADTALNLLISLLCLAFGIALLFGQGHLLQF
jgi:hypothetical protein